NTTNYIQYYSYHVSIGWKNCVYKTIVFPAFFSEFSITSEFRFKFNKNLIYKEVPIVAKKAIKPVDNHANQKNANKGTKGQNRQHSQVHGNRSKQLQQNHTASEQLGK
ncbi:MAG: hypothetical protein J6R96_06530, partial [Spirochaetaceae bacterium]|nr:hypothetical protein [Spirochaetaceae bacterium]